MPSSNRGCTTQGAGHTEIVCGRYRQQIFKETPGLLVAAGWAVSGQGWEAA